MNFLPRTSLIYKCRYCFSQKADLIFHNAKISVHVLGINLLPADGEFSRLMIIFANSLDPHQARQDVGPDLDPNRLTP